MEQIIDREISTLISLRHYLHQNPEVSGEEKNTTQTLLDYIRQKKPDELFIPNDFYGFVALYRGDENLPSVAFRSDIDALPIPDEIDEEYKSKETEAGHKCGHDGHAVTLLGMAGYLHDSREQKRGHRYLVFQPAEENGVGGEQMLLWMRHMDIVPEYMFGFHNIPGHELGELIHKPQTFCLASVGLIMKFKGYSSHAAEPENGRNPAYAIGKILSALEEISFQVIPGNTQIITPIYSKIGKMAFGTNPGNGSLMLTCRASNNEMLEDLIERIRSIANKECEVYGLSLKVSRTDYFPAVINHDSAYNILLQAAGQTNKHQLVTAMRWSEDFGHFGRLSRCCYYGLGGGFECPPLHHPEYDFPDELIEHGITLYKKISEAI